MKRDIQEALEEVIGRMTEKAFDGEFDMDNTPKFTDEELEVAFLSDIGGFTQKYNETILFLMKWVKRDYDSIRKEHEEDDIA